MFGALKRILGLDHPQQKPLPMAQKAQSIQSQPIQLGGPVQAVDGYYPQDNTAPMDDPTDVGNYYQPSYQNPQTTINSGYQQNQGINLYGNPSTQNLQSTADPYGWLRQQLRY